MFRLLLVLFSLLNGMESGTKAQNKVYTKWPLREFRAVWVATVHNTDWPSTDRLDTEQQKQELETLVATVNKLHFNAIVFQIRTSGDAMYNSSLEPWSVYLAGKQGKAPDPFYDPLEFLIQKAHMTGIEVHAWFNAFTARSGNTSRSGLAPNHMARRFPEYAYAYGSYLWMDPGAVVVQDHVVKVYTDVARRYDIDGLHTDDSFYPYPVSGQDFPDDKTYYSYLSHGGVSDVASWRRYNLNSIIQRLEREVHAIKPYLKFGISPFGIWKPGHPSGIKGLSAYDSLYADSQRWLNDGWVDYLSPQLYWRIDPPQQSYPALLEWWLKQNSFSRHVYVGNYAAGVALNNWNVDELVNQVTISRNRRQNLSLGNIQFSMKYFINNNRSIADAFGKLYQSRALTPEMAWLNVSAPPTHVNVQVTSGRTIVWKPDTSGVTMYTVIYRETADGFELYATVPAMTSSVTNVPENVYAIRNINRAGTESSAVYVKVIDTGSKTIEVERVVMSSTVDS